MKKKKDYSQLKAYVAVAGILGLGFIVYFYGNYKASREYYLRSYHFLEKKNYYAAGECLEASLQYDQNFAEAYFLLGKIDLEAIHDPKGALKSLDKALEYSNKPKGVMYFLRGKARFLLKRPDIENSRIDFHTAVKIDPTLDSSYFYLGRIYDLKQDSQKAISSYREFLKEADRSAFVYFRRGINYYQNNQFDKALDDFNKGLEKEDNGEIYYLRGLCHLQNNNKDKACTDFANAISADYDEAMNKQEEVCGSADIEELIY